MMLLWAGMPVNAGETMDSAVQTALARQDGSSAGAGARAGLRVSPEVDAVQARLGSQSPLPIGTDGRPMADLAGVNYRLWVGRGRTELGVGVGALGYVQGSPDPRESESARTLVGASPAFAVGVRHRVSPASLVYADAVGTRTLGGEPGAAYVRTKVGIEWKPATRRFGFDHGALGVHLDSGYRLALKAHHGGLGLYLRGQF
jgi:hypothetical protein